MKKANRALGAVLILLAGSLLVPGITSGQALKTPIAGRWENCRTLEEPDREWVDEDGIQHGRGERGRCDHVGNIRGRDPAGEIWVTDWDQDLDAGTYFEHGTMTFSGRILWMSGLTATGHFTTECTRSDGVWTCTQEDVWYLENGRLLKFSGTWVEGNPRFYTGFLLDPPPGLRRTGVWEQAIAPSRAAAK